MGRTQTHLIQRAHLISLWPGWRRFVRASERPRQAQLARLKAIVARGRDSAYGRACGMDKVADLRGFQDRVPVVDYSDLAPWVERVARGERGVLTGEPVLMMERSSGSTAGNKLIPYTASLRAEFGAATSPWLMDMHHSHPALMGRRSYWSISPVSRGQETTPGGLPVGFEDDTEYFSPVERWALSKMMAVDSSVARAPTMRDWFEQSAQQLLSAQDLGMLSVWSPTFLVRLFDDIKAHLDDLLVGLDAGVSAAISERLQRAGTLTGEVLWPELALISCWTDGPSEGFLPALRQRFPTTQIQPKGLLATEGVVSFPMGRGDAQGAVLAVAGHFLEFEPLEGPSRRPVLVDDLRPGARYAPLLTTSGGFYRYRLGDVIEVSEARFGQTPRVSFVGRMDGCSDLCGEKLDPSSVGAGIEKVRAQIEAQMSEVSFAILAPETEGHARYCLFLDTEAPHSDLARAAETMEAHLQINHHYRYCRDLGQLGPVEVHRVEAGWRRYEARMVAQGVRMGDIKPRVLARSSWLTPPPVPLPAKRSGGTLPG